MENVANEQVTAVVYESPALVELGEFSEDTLGSAGRNVPDSSGRSRTG